MSCRSYDCDFQEEEIKTLMPEKFTNDKLIDFEMTGYGGHVFIPGLNVHVNFKTLLKYIGLFIIVVLVSKFILKKL